MDKDFPEDPSTTTLSSSTSAKHEDYRYNGAESATTTAAVGAAASKEASNHHHHHHHLLVEMVVEDMEHLSRVPFPLVEEESKKDPQEEKIVVPTYPPSGNDEQQQQPEQEQELLLEQQKQQQQQIEQPTTTTTTTTTAGTDSGNNSKQILPKPLKKPRAKPGFGARTSRTNIVETGQKRRSCVCSRNKKCNEYMMKWAKVSPPEYHYVQLPKEHKLNVGLESDGLLLGAVSDSTKDPNTTTTATTTTSSSNHNDAGISDTDLYKNGFRSATLRSLSTKHPLPKDERIALCHYHPEVRPYLFWPKNTPTVQKYAIPESLALKLGYDVEANRCQGLNTEKYCYALPIYPFEDAQAEIDRLETKFLEKVRQIQTNPHQFARDLCRCEEDQKVVQKLRTWNKELLRKLDDRRRTIKRLKSILRVQKHSHFHHPQHHHQQQQLYAAAAPQQQQQQHESSLYPSSVSQQPKPQHHHQEIPFFPPGQQQQQQQIDNHSSNGYPQQQHHHHHHHHPLEAAMAAAVVTGFKDDEAVPTPAEANHPNHLVEVAMVHHHLDEMGGHQDLNGANHNSNNNNNTNNNNTILELEDLYHSEEDDDDEYEYDCEDCEILEPTYKGGNSSSLMMMQQRPRKWPRKTVSVDRTKRKQHQKRKATPPAVTTTTATTIRRKNLPSNPK